jgi:hypothetical protein
MCASGRSRNKQRQQVLKRKPKPKKEPGKAKPEPDPKPKKDTGKAGKEPPEPEHDVPPAPEPADEVPAREEPEEKGAMPMSTPALGVRTWTTAVNETVWACGCRALTNVTPNALITWCGQPDCLRLFAAGVAYTQRQFDWQVSRGGTPTLVAALLRPMVTPLPQILPAPTSGQYFSMDVNDGTVADINAAGAAPASAKEEANDTSSRTSRTRST